MKKIEFKSKTSAVAIVLLLFLSTIMVAVLTVQAQERPVVEYETSAFIIATPNPVGLYQDTYVQFRIDKVSPTVIGLEGGEHFTGFIVNITKPDGQTDESGPYTADATSGSWFIFTPDQVGEYTLQVSFPGQWINGTQVIFGFPGPDEDRWYKPSTSLPQTLTVQNDPIEPWPDVPLPTDEWRRPIYGENKGWYQIADNWLMPSYDITSRGFHWSPAYAPYTSGPNSPHILWTKQARYGGIVGGQFGDDTYYTGLSYEEPIPNKLILGGRLIYTERTHGSDDLGAQYSLGGATFDYGDLGTRILDLYTGEEIMYLNNTIINFAQTLLFDTGNQHGVTPHLWQSIPGGYNVYDAFTGAYMFTINNVPGGTTKFGPNGEILIYTLSNGHLSMWNSTKAIITVSQPRWGVTVRGEYYNIPIGSQVNGSLGMEWNVSVPDVGVPLSISLINVNENVIIASYETSGIYPTETTEVAYPTILDKDSNGEYPTSINHKWLKTRTDVGGQAYETYGKTSINIDDGVYAAFDEESAELFAYSAVTGDELWSTGQIPSEGLITFSHNVVVAYGKVYLSGYDGHVRAFHSENGTLAWDYYKGSAGYETPFGTWPDYGGYTIADGKVYVSADDHSIESILWRGSRLWAIDAYTGEELWQVSGMLRQPVVADGILVALNSLDGQIYAFGKGPSATTVTAPDEGIALGESLVIKGTVTDQTPAQKGTPAVSDESMGDWMGYLHQQKPLPSDATGVEVTIDVLDPTGEYRTIGTVITDLSGNFGLAYEPETEGFYTVIATFAGSNSYGSSYSVTYFNVDPAPSQGEPIEPEEQAPLITTEVAILIAVVVIAAVAIAAYWVLRRR